MKSDANLSYRRAAAIYSVPRRTLRDRRAKTTSRRDFHPNLSRLTGIEEDKIIQYIRKLDARDFAPTLSYVCEMANKLLAARGGQIEENWAYRLTCRKPEIKSEVTRQRGHERVLCSDPAIINPWFNLVHNVIAKYGILDEDTYHFDETGFQMGVGGFLRVVTASERRLRPLQVQPGDREWATLIVAIIAMGWVIPPFIIFKAKNHNQAWYRS
jgi:hypothetical protein